jgi:heme oxygenase (biliverdin-producing, ferredoxin)
MSLRDAIKAKHDAAEAHPFTTLMFSGAMSDRDYATYLFNMVRVYDSLETNARAQGLLDDLDGIERVEPILNDFAELGIIDRIPVVPAAQEYAAYLASVPSVLAHLYVRHMGDMYGGQMIKAKIPGKGTMYEFENRAELVAKLRAKLTDDLADEANVAFDFVLKIFDDLAHEFLITTGPHEKEPI